MRLVAAPEAPPIHSRYRAAISLAGTRRTVAHDPGSWDSVAVPAWVRMMVAGSGPGPPVPQTIPEEPWIRRTSSGEGPALCGAREARWCTILREAVTCAECLVALADREGSRPPGARADAGALAPASKLMP